MERLTGREAITAKAEYNLGKRKCTEAEVKYINKQILSFRTWLMNQQGLGMHEATEACQRIYDSDVKLLTEDDPFADFIWSRGQDVGDMEVDAALSLSSDPERQWDAEFKSYQRYWEGIEGTAERNSSGYMLDYWKRSQEKFEQILEALNKLKARYQGRILMSSDQLFLAKVSKRLDILRFGSTTTLNGVKHMKGGGEITYRHWALARNMLNEIRGIQKRYEIKEPKEKENEERTEEYIDALDNAVYSLSEKYAL